MHPLRRSRLPLAVGALIAAGLMTPTAALATTTSYPAVPASGPWVVAVAASGDVFTGNADSTISRWTPAGALAGAPWPVSIAPGQFPMAITTDDEGTLYTANNQSDSVSKITPSGGVTALGIGGAVGPQGIAIDAAGTLYTANSATNNITKITPDGTATIIPLDPSDSGPSALTIDPSGNVFVANFGSNNVTKVSPDGTATVLGPTGFLPYGITLDSAGNVYTVNVGDLNVTKITPTGVSTTLGLTGGPTPWAITIDSANNLYVPDDSLDQVFRITPDGVTTPVATVDHMPRAISIDGAGNLYTANFAGDNVTRISGGGGTPEIAPAPPRRPAAPVATAGVSSITLTMPPGAPDARYGTPSSYVLTVVGDDSLTCTITAPATSCTISALTPGDSYTFTAVAVLNAWHTARSAPSAPAIPTVAPPATTPAASASVQLSAAILPSQRTLVSGQRTRIAIRVRNTGTADASAVTSCVTLPANMVVASAATASRHPHTACFAIDGLAAGAQATRTVIARVWSAVTVTRRVTGSARAQEVTPVQAAPARVTITPRRRHVPVTG